MGINSPELALSQLPQVQGLWAEALPLPQLQLVLWNGDGASSVLDFPFFFSAYTYSSWD